MKPDYVSLSNPNDLTFPALRYPAEPALGGTYGAEERQALLQAFDDACNRDTGFNAAREVERLEQVFCHRYKTKFAIAVNGANSALDLVLKAIGVSESDEVISAGATFHGQHLAVLGSGANLVLADIAEVDCCLSAGAVAAQLSARTKVIIATDVHGACADYAGIRRVLDVWQETNPGARPFLISDAARSIGSQDGPASANCCDFTIFSLQSKKLVTALGEGGIVLTNNAHYADLLRQYRAFGLGQGWGSNFKMSKLQASVAVVQMERLDGIVNSRNALASDRIARLRPYASIMTPVTPLNRHHTFQFFPLMLAERLAGRRNEIMRLLAQDESIGTVVANPPSYQYNRWIAAHSPTRLPTTERITDRLLCVSFHHDYSVQDEAYIINGLIRVISEIAKDC